jgi:hypothetical protein
MPFIPDEELGKFVAVGKGGAVCSLLFTLRVFESCVSSVGQDDGKTVTVPVRLGGSESRIWLYVR